MKFFLLLILVIFNASADEIRLVSTSDAGKKFSYMKTFVVTNNSYTLNEYCSAISKTPKLLIDELKKTCFTESMFFSSANYSSCNWNSNQEIEMVGEFQCVDKALEFKDLDCQSQAECEQKRMIEGLKARRMWFESTLSKLPTSGSKKAKQFLESPDNLEEFSNCYLNLVKIAFTPLYDSQDAQLPEICTKVIEKYEAYKQ